MAFFRRLSSPRVYLPSLVVATAGAVSVAAWLLFENWLVALILALSVLLFVLVLLVVRMMIGREREDRLDRGLEGGEEIRAARSIERRDTARRGLQTSFKEAVAEIRSQLDAGVSELPWFLLIGGPGSGKTTLLGESGLDVPAEYARSRVAGPTLGLEFYLSNEAIMLDTPGGYFDGGEHDEEDWRTLLKLLRGARPDCPIDGVIFALPAATLLTDSDEQLRQTAHQLRRRLNEIEDKLGVVAPIYLVLTKSDLIEGFVETAERLPQPLVEGAFGWTNDRREVVEHSAVDHAFVEISERLDRFLPGLLLGEQDPRRQRSIFLLPQELLEVGRRASHFVAEAFKPSVYKSEKPFLRGVYMVSSRPEGTALSPSLQRLGQSRACTSHHAVQSSGLFQRELFLDIISGDEGVAIPGGRLGPLGRRLVLGVGAALGAVAISVWSFSFASNYQGAARLATLARLLQSTDPPLQDIDQMRHAIDEESANAAGFANSVGFGLLGESVDRAKDGFVAAFRTHYDGPSKQRLGDALRRGSDRSVDAAVRLAGDIGFLLDPLNAPTPELSPYLSLRVKSPERYVEIYRAFGSWMSEADRLILLREEQDLFESVVERILDIYRLEEITRPATGSYPSVGYPAELGRADGGTERIPGLYTKTGFDGLVSTLLEAYGRSGTASPGKLKRFQRTYLERFDRSWLRYLLDVPELASDDAALKESPYLALISQVEQNTRADLERENGVPAWVRKVRHVRGPLSLDPNVPAPWLTYQEALDIVAVDVEGANAVGTQALSLARDVALDKPNSFTEALDTVHRILPRGNDSAITTKLRTLLELPVLNAFSSVARAALRELDETWQQQIALPFAGSCDERCLANLYGASGEYERFRQDDLAPFYGEAGLRLLLENRALPFGPEFLSWMENGAILQRRLPGGLTGSSVPVRVRAIPPRVTDLSGLRAKRIELRLQCPEEAQTFVYRSGDHSHTFNWTSACDQLTLRVSLARLGETSERQLERVWRGPFALPNFLKDGESTGSQRLLWNLAESGLVVVVRYEILSGQELREMAHQTPPSSMGS